jgi:hypothetical protein
VRQVAFQGCSCGGSQALENEIGERFPITWLVFWDGRGREVETSSEIRGSNSRSLFAASECISAQSGMLVRTDAMTG